MKNLIVLLLLLIPSICIAQKDAKMITMEDFNKSKSTIESPQARYYRLFVNVNHLEVKQEIQQIKTKPTSPDKPGFVGSNADPLKDIRTAPIGNPVQTTRRIDVYSGSEYNKTNTTQRIEIKVSK